jgi:transcriptional regulator with XRE-family HTH domain
MAGRRCQTCDANLSVGTIQAVCPTCHVAAGLPAPRDVARRGIPTMWLWSGAEAVTALASRDLAVILRVYRRLNNLNQDKLAALLGYDKTYISMIETRRRTISDLPARRHIARTLGLPPHVLGITSADDADFTAMCQFGDSTIRLAEIARQAGRAVEAVNELWPLVARLEARAAEGHTERETLVLLGQARVALGVSLGTVLPEERLATAARWTGKALAIAEHLDDPAFLAHTLRMHGNELRKADHVPAAIARLHRAARISTDRQGQGTALALLARAAGEHGDAALFDHAITRYRALLDTDSGRGMLFNPFTFREIHLRGLVHTGRAGLAVRDMLDTPLDATAVAPQWQIIERVTAGEVYLAAGRRDDADNALRSAVTAAEAHQLPHQVQRVIRVARQGQLADLATEANAVVSRLRARLTPATP